MNRNKIKKMVLALISEVDYDIYKDYKRPSAKLELDRLIDLADKHINKPLKKLPKKIVIVSTNTDCEICNSPDATFGPDPFAAEINNNLTDHWLCSECRDKSAIEI